MRLVLLAALSLAVLAGLWVILKPAPPSVPTVSSSAAPPAAAIAPVAAEAVGVPAPRRFALTLPAAPGEPGAVLAVRVGERVELTVTSREDDELHLHGYDLALPLRAGAPAVLAFTAEHAGRFDLELHHRHAEVGVLEVSPR